MTVKVISITSEGKQKLVDFDPANIVLTDVDCDASVYVGAIVRLDASGVAHNAIADSTANSNLIGICESKDTTILCNIRVLGTTTEIFTGLDPSREYFLSDTVYGGISTTVPTTSGHVIIKVGQPFSSTRMVVLKGQRSVRA